MQPNIGPALTFSHTKTSETISQLDPRWGQLDLIIEDKKMIALKSFNLEIHDDVHYNAQMKWDHKI